MPWPVLLKIMGKISVVDRSLSHNVHLRRVFSASAETLFAAWTDPDQLLQWWGPPGSVVQSVEVDLRQGGSYRIGFLHPDGNAYHVYGVYQEIQPPRKLAFTWRWEQPQMDIGESLVTLLFESESPQKTAVILTHSQLPSEDARHHHEEGWTGILQNLITYLATASGQ